jgi:predicted choloylglycine hydrolase
MRYEGAYDRMKNVAQPTPTTPFGCSLFATNDATDPLFARNFDWDPAPAMLLFTSPPDGHASVSMVDLSYLGITDPREGDLTDAPLLPFDGMNEKGLAIGLAAVPDGEAGSRPDRPTVGSVRIIRLVLDKAATVEEAVEVFESHNIDFSGGPTLHYLVADASGKSVAIEFVDGEVVTLPTQAAVNFTLTGTDEAARSTDTRYRTTTEGLRPGMDWKSAMTLLSEVQQGHTQWSVVYGLKTGEVHLTTDKLYDRVHEFTLDR